MTDLAPWRRQIEAALKHAGGTHTFANVQDSVSAGAAQFWPGIHSAIITEIHRYPSGDRLHFWLAGGNLEELRAMYPAVEAWGVARGCMAATMTGRSGWARTFLTREEEWRESPLRIFEKKLQAGPQEQDNG